eukprot:TRINITY_DN12461_c0_g1_i4.p1 TRINITY_DN12461_c0_g1~~TRINITY_DN12461_c0_g1_i4.p1  ORF type:complete len:751 (+),score=205.15 TRINITY_DN12461_c0_g1_i4:1867-4119(+)
MSTFLGDDSLPNSYSRSGSLSERPPMSPSQHTLRHLSSPRMNQSSPRLLDATADVPTHGFHPSFRPDRAQSRSSSTPPRKTYILDTSVLLHDPNALNSFEEHTVCIPLSVIADLDRHKKSPGAVGANARATIRQLDQLRTNGDLCNGVYNEASGGHVRILTHHTQRGGEEGDRLPSINDNGDMSSGDWVISFAMSLTKAARRLGDASQVVLVSKDMIVRLKANALMLTVNDYTTQQARDVEETYLGYVELNVDPIVVDRTLAQGRERAELAGRKATAPTRGEVMGHSHADDQGQAPSFATTGADVVVRVEQAPEEKETTDQATDELATPTTTTTMPVPDALEIKSDDSILSEGYVQDLVSQRGDINANYFAVLRDSKESERLALGRFVPEVSQSHEETDKERAVRLATTDKASEKEQGELRNIIDRKLHLKAVDVERTVWNVTARSIQQVMAMELLMDPTVSLVTLVGQAGTGKTLVALAAGLELVLHQDRYKKILVTRPVVALGQDIGYLPGSKDQKMGQWMQPIFDNLSFMSNTSDIAQEQRMADNNPFSALSQDSVRLRWAITSSPITKRKGRRRRHRQRSFNQDDVTPDHVQQRYRDLGFSVGKDDMIDPEPASTSDEEEEEAYVGSGVSRAFIAKRATQEKIQKVVQMEAITYIRGRSIQDEYVIVDECQNLTPHEVKTIISRAGEGTKIVLCGDPHQIDNPYLDATTNGLSYVVDRLQGVSIYGHVTLHRTVRSTLAAVAAEML